MRIRILIKVESAKLEVKSHLSYPGREAGKPKATSATDGCLGPGAVEELLGSAPFFMRFQAG